MCCHQVHNGWSSKYPLQMQNMEGRRERSVHGAGCVESSGGFWWCVGLILLRRWVREKTNNHHQKAQWCKWYKKWCRVTCPHTGRDVRHCHAGKSLKWGCCASAEANRHTGHVSLPGIYPHTSLASCEFFSSAAANIHWSQEQSGSSERDVILPFSYQVLHLIEPAGEKGWS